MFLLVKTRVRNIHRLFIPSCAPNILVAGRVNYFFFQVSPQTAVFQTTVSLPSLPILFRGLVVVAAGALVLNCTISCLQRHVTRFIPRLTAVLEARRARQAVINEMFFLCLTEPFILTAPYTWGLNCFLLCSCCCREECQICRAFEPGNARTVWAASFHLLAYVHSRGASTLCISLHCFRLTCVPPQGDTRDFYLCRSRLFLLPATFCYAY